MHFSSILVSCEDVFTFPSSSSSVQDGENEDFGEHSALGAWLLGRRRIGIIILTLETSFPMLLGSCGGFAACHLILREVSGFDCLFQCLFCHTQLLGGCHQISLAFVFWEGIRLSKGS